MRKTIVFIVFAIIIGIKGSAQPMKKGEQSLGLAVGIPAIIGYDYTSRGMAITAIYDYGYTNKLGVGYITAGGILSYAGSDYDYRYLNTPYSDDYHYVVLGPRVAYHFDMVELTESSEWNKVDLYAGMFVGARFQTLKFTNPLTGGKEKETKTKLATDIFAGIRYAINNRVGAFAELGFGVTYFNLGVNVRF